MGGIQFLLADGRIKQDIPNESIRVIHETEQIRNKSSTFILGHMIDSLL